LAGLAGTSVFLIFPMIDMNFAMNFRVFSTVCVLSLTSVLSAQAQTPSVAAQVPAGSFATVNSLPLPNSLLELVLKNNAAQGVANSPELRNVVRGELISRAALSQEAAKLGLDKQDTALAQMELL
jgi:hypothetical protein